MNIIIIFLLLLTSWSDYGIVSSNAAQTVPMRGYREEASLIVQDMKKALTIGEDVSVDCWENVVNALSASTVVPHRHNQQQQHEQQQNQQHQHAVHFSEGANFCSSMEEGKQQALTLGLTKCHLLRNGSRKLPDICHSDSIFLGEDEQGLQSCLSNLDHAQYNLYSDYLRDTGRMCRELMEDMQIHRKDEMINRYEEYARATHLDTQNLKNMWKQNEESAATRMDDIKESAEMMNRNIENWKQIEHIPNLINEIPNLVNNVLDSMEERIANKLSNWSSSAIGKVSLWKLVCFCIKSTIKVPVSHMCDKHSH